MDSYKTITHVRIREHIYCTVKRDIVLRISIPKKLISSRTFYWSFNLHERIIQIWPLHEIIRKDKVARLPKLA